MLGERNPSRDRRSGAPSREPDGWRCHGAGWSWRKPATGVWAAGVVLSGALLGPSFMDSHADAGGARDRQDARPGPSVPQTQRRSRRSAESLYAARCASCHGKDLNRPGRSLMAKGSRYEAADADIEGGIRERHRDRAGARLDDLSSGEVRALVIWIQEKRAGSELIPRVSGAVPRVVEVANSSEPFTIETVVEGVEDPWGLAFLPDGGMLVTEHGGRLRRVSGQGDSQTIAGTPAVWARGQGGLLDVAVDPRYSDNGWIYLTSTILGPCSPQ